MMMMIRKPFSAKRFGSQPLIEVAKQRRVRRIKELLELPILLILPRDLYSDFPSAEEVFNQQSKGQKAFTLQPIRRPQYTHTHTQS